MQLGEHLALAEIPAGRGERDVKPGLSDSFLRRHGYIVPSFVLAMLVCAGFVTWGGWKFFVPEDFSGFYDAQALSMIDGRFDVPPAAIGSEAFIFHGKAYGYFGIAPALLRIPLVIVFEGMEGRWSRLMMMIGCAINLICAYRILRLVRGEAKVTGTTQRLWHALFVICAGIGSTNVFLAGRSFTFHEAIMWGGAFSLLFAWTILKYLAEPGYWRLGLAGFFAFMAFHSRPTAGAGALLAMLVISAIMTWRALTRSQDAQSFLGLKAVAKPGRHALLAALMAAVTLLTYFGVNYAKFQTFEGVPLRYYAWYNAVPMRMKITGGKQLHLENIPTSIATYFGIRGLSFDRTFPWVAPAHEATIVGSPAIDVVEDFSTFPISMPALSLLAVLGCALLLRGQTETIRRARLPALTLLLGGAVILATVGITERYLHDFYPALILAAAIGVSRIESGKHAVAKWGVIVPLAVISVALNCSFSLIHQRKESGRPASERRLPASAVR